MLKNLNFKRRLQIGFGTLITLIVILGLVSFFSISTASKSFSKYRSIARTTNITGRIQSNMLKLRMTVKNFQVNGDSVFIEDYKTVYKLLEKLINEGIQEITDPEQKDEVVLINHRLKEYDANFRKIVELRNNRNYFVFSVLDVHGPSMEKALSSILESAEEDNDEVASFHAAHALKHVLLGRLYVTKFLDKNDSLSVERVYLEFSILHKQMDILISDLQNPQRIQLANQVQELKETYLSTFVQLVKVIQKRNKIQKDILDVIGPQIATSIETIKREVKLQQDTLGPEFQAQNLITIILIGVVGLFALIIGVIFSIIIIGRFSKPIAVITEAAVSLSKGVVNLDLDIHSKDEIGILADSFNRIIQSQKDKTQAAEKIADGNYNVGVKIYSEHDQLGKSMVLMREALKKREKELIKANEELELKVAERTMDLESSLKDIQNLNSQLSSQNQALNMSAIVSIADKKGNIIHVNDEFCRVSQYSKQELIGKNHRIVNSGLHPKEFWFNLWKTIAKGNIWRNEVRNKCKDGSYYWVDTVVVPILDSAGKPKEYLSIRFEITERKEMEQELAYAKEAAEAATQAKSSFLATMSHEIRTPMNAIIGLTNLALKTNLDSKQKDYLEKVDRSAFSLLGIINDILDFSKIEAGKLHIENVAFDLEEVFENISNLNAGKAQDKGLEFNIRIDKEVPFYLHGDSLRVGQIITNYCSNAIKFTEKGEVVVGVEFGEQIEDNKIKINFSVKDTGIGLSKEQQGKMFQEFSQADSSTTRKFGGTGLGLAISKRLAELMGGTTWLESKEGEGSTFYFSGVFGVQDLDKRTEFNSPDDLKSIKILACDDNSTARAILKEAIHTFGFEINLVKSGKDCLEELKTNHYELLIIDWLMPEMDGLDVVKQIKQENSLNDLKIIMISAFGSESVAEAAKEFGLNHFISKPFTYSTLFDAIMNVFGKDIRTSRIRIERGKKHKKALQKISGATVLLTEDNEINQQVAVELLEDEGFVVEIANNGKEAFDKIKASGEPSKYDLVFMDLQMPVMDGFTATMEIRNLSQYNDVPIIAMTADAMSGVKEKCLEAGMNDMVTKPIDPDEMFGVMVEWIKPDEKLKDRRRKTKDQRPKTNSQIFLLYLD